MTPSTLQVLVGVSSGKFVVFTRAERSELAFWRVAFQVFCDGLPDQFRLGLPQLLGGLRQAVLQVRAEDQRHWLLFTVGIRTRTGQSKLPAQASIYRFLWRLEQDINALEHALTCWASMLLNTRSTPGELICVNADGKYLLDTTRPRAGQGALLLLSAFLTGLGLSLMQTRVTGSEAQAVKSLIPTLKTLLPKDAWLLTSDAGLTERDLARKITNAHGHYFMRVKRNQLEALEMSAWVFHYPPDSSETRFFEDEYRSGELWFWQVRASSALPEKLRTGFPGVVAVHLTRRVAPGFWGNPV